MSMPVRFDREVVAELLAELRRELNHGARELRLDLSKVESFDSAGMALVVDAIAMAKSKGARVQVIGVQDSVADFFSLLSVERLIRKDTSKERVGVIESIGNSVLSCCAAFRHGGILLSKAACGLVLAPFRGEKTRVARIVDGDG